MKRACPPDETFGRVAPYLAGYGITRVSRHTGLDFVGIPVWCAYTPNAKSIVVAHGKGLTDADARTSATMEALERAVACDPQVKLRLATQLELHHAGLKYDLLPELLAPGQDVGAQEEEMTFVEATDLLTGSTVFVPLDAAVLDRTIPAVRYWKSSDGLASGNTVEEAIFHGLLERVERDAMALWQLWPAWRQQASVRHPEAFENPDVNALAKQVEQAGLLLRLFEVTSDIGIPTVAAYIGEPSVSATSRSRYVDVTFGCGTNPDVSKAALRAITEAAQSRLTYISGARDDVYQETYVKPLSDDIRRLMTIQNIPNAPIKANREQGAIVEILKRHGLTRLYCVRLSEPALPFAVVKIFAPELENPPGDRKFKLGVRAFSAALSP
jgi:ribosomal protein S12 methylthiotransferase accessory factor